MGSGILVYAEHDGGKIKSTAYELLTKARELAGAIGGSVSAVLVGSGDAGELGNYGAETVYTVTGDALNTYTTGGYTKAMAHLSCKAALAQKKTAFVAGSAARRPREEADAEPAAKRFRSEEVEDTPAQPAREAESISADPREDPADQAAEEACEPVGPRNCPPELEALSAREFAKAEAIVAKLHENMGHCSMRTVTSALQRRKAHPVLLEMSKWWKCQACEEALRLPFLPVASGRVEVPHLALGLDQFQWTHPVGHAHVRATLLIDQGSRLLLCRYTKTSRRKRASGTPVQKKCGTP